MTNGASVTWRRIRVGAGNFNEWLHSRGRVDSPDCEQCEEAETLDHLLFDCAARHAEQNTLQTYLRRAMQLPQSETISSVSGLCERIRETAASKDNNLKTENIVDPVAVALHCYISLIDRWL